MLCMLLLLLTPYMLDMQAMHYPLAHFAMKHYKMLLYIIVSCPSLTDPNNGTITCSLGDDGVPSYEDTYSFTCNNGYELTGSPQRTCQSDGSWSESPVSCTIMECPSSSLPMNSMLGESCSSTYQSMCDLQCEEGFNGSGDPSYVCNVLSDGSVMWMTSGGRWDCERSKLLFCR